MKTLTIEYMLHWINPKPLSTIHDDKGSLDGESHYVQKHTYISPLNELTPKAIKRILGTIVLHGKAEEASNVTIINIQIT